MSAWIEIKVWALSAAPEDVALLISKLNKITLSNELIDKYLGAIYLT